MASYLSDPGGVFDSDTHRRVLGHLPLPDDDALPIHGPGGHKAHAKSIGHRISRDPYRGLGSVAELEEVLGDLEADGYAEQTDDGWRMTQDGLDALKAPAPERVGQVEAAILDGLVSNGEGGLNG